MTENTYADVRDALVNKSSTFAYQSRPSSAIIRFLTRWRVLRSAISLDRLHVSLFRSRTAYFLFFFFFNLKNSLFRVLSSIADRKMSVTCPSNARKFADRGIFLTHECDATHFAIRALCLSFREENDKAFRRRKVRQLVERREIETMSTRAERNFREYRLVDGNRGRYFSSTFDRRLSFRSHFSCRVSLMRLCIFSHDRDATFLGYSGRRGQINRAAVAMSLSNFQLFVLHRSKSDDGDRWWSRGGRLGWSSVYQHQAEGAEYLVEPQLRR